MRRQRRWSTIGNSNLHAQTLDHSHTSSSLGTSPNSSPVLAFGHDATAAKPATHGSYPPEVQVVIAARRRKKCNYRAGAPQSLPPIDGVRSSHVVTKAPPTLSTCASAADRSLENALSHHIELIQNERKTFKDEWWYTSGIGCGSKASVVLAALKAHDPCGLGTVTCNQLVKTLSCPLFGLQEQQARALVNNTMHGETEPLADTSPVAYREFVRKLNLPPARTNDSDRSIANAIVESHHKALNIMHRVSQETLNECVRRHGTEQMAAADPQAQRQLPHEQFESTTRPEPVDMDFSGFEYDKFRKERRAVFKSRVLNAHLARIAQCTHQQDIDRQTQQTLHQVAATQLQIEQLTRARDQASRDRRREAKRDHKALVKSEFSQKMRNVSHDSMFYQSMAN